MASNQNAAVIAGLEPKAVWGFFAGLADVPRPSKHEERVAKHVKELAEQHGLNVNVVEAGNLVIQVPASKGHERAPVTVLQAHLDMVCEKNSGTAHDFDKEGIRFIKDKDKETGESVIRADGTTLGADNGIGVALALAAATEPDVVRGPLELLLTLDEEDGMTGAKAISATSFKGRRMINLDSEEDDALYIGCAGGCDSNLTWRCAAHDLPEGIEAVRVQVTGLRGGHSGGEIHEGRSNAIKLLVRTLLHSRAAGMRLVSIHGGSKRNAIPREAEAVVAGPIGTFDAINLTAAIVTEEAKVESLEAGVKIKVDIPVRHPASGVSETDTMRVLSALMAVPSGVLGMHPTVAGLVETSNNLSTVNSRVEDGHVVISAGMLSRSSSESRKQETVVQLACIGQLAGAEVTTANDYPGWAPDPKSPTLSVCKRVYTELFGKEPNVAAIHAGLECGIIGKRVGGMDMVSLGPTIRGAHSPDERVFIDSVGRTWRYLKAVLAELAKG